MSEDRKKELALESEKLDKFIGRELEITRESFEEGNLGALKDALCCCAKYNLPLPVWLASELIKLVNANLGIAELKHSEVFEKPIPDALGKKLLSLIDDGHKMVPERTEHEKNRSIRTARQKGQQARWIQQYKDDRIDFFRAETVQWLRDEYGLKRHIFYAAEKLLDGTVAAGRDEAIKKSCQRFKKRYAENPRRYLELRTVRIAADFLPDKAAVWKRIEKLRKK